MPRPGFPWHHVIGFVLSLLLTVAALWLTLAHALRGGLLLALILALAALQMGVQLFFFMHVTDRHGPRYHIMALALAMFFTLAIVAGSLWIMTFGGYQAY